MVSRSHAIFAVALVASAALHGAVIVHAIAESDAGFVVGALTTGGLAWAALRRSLRSKAPELVWPFVAVLAGVCNAWLAWLVLRFTPNVAPRLADVPFWGVLVGGPFAGGLIAIPFAAMGWLIVISAVNAARHPSLDRPWNAVLIAGVWTTASALISYASLRDAMQVAPVTMILGALGVAAAIVGSLVLGGRALWLARVRRGAVPGWVVVTAAELGPPGVVLASELLPWSSAYAGNAVLARERRAGVGAYREGSTRDVVAWV